MDNETIENIIKNGDDFEIIFSIINIEKFNSDIVAKQFINLLTGHSNPIREAVAYRLEDITKTEINYFLNDFAILKILDAIVDINPNVSRSICNLICKFDILKEKLEYDLIIKIENLLSEIKDFEQKTKNSFKQNTKSHAKNKKLFSLYWLLEALSICYSNKYEDKVIKILNVTIDFSDFTIREKTAKILAVMPNPNFELLQKAKRDLNFYVKMQVYDKINIDD